MAKEKQKKPLTAKQRKEQNRKTTGLSYKTINPSAEKPETKALESGLKQDTAVKDPSGLTPQNHFSRKKILLLSFALFFAVVVISLAVLIPVSIMPAIRYGKTDNPTAAVYLDNGMKLEFEILEKECPVAATNFLYLAKNKFFEGVIFFDSQNSFLRFGGYTDPENYSERKEKTKEFNDTVYDIKIPSTQYDQVNKFQYILNKDTGDAAVKPMVSGTLSFMAGETGSATHFEICVDDNTAQEWVQNDTGYRKTVTGISFGRYFDDDTLANLTKLQQTLSATKTAPKSVSYWKTPESTVRIKKITLHNMDNAKWKKFRFGKDFLVENSNWKDQE